MQAPDGSSFKVTKGAAHAVLSLIQTNTEVITSSVNQKVCYLLLIPVFYLFMYFACTWLAQMFATHL